MRRATHGGGTRLRTKGQGDKGGARPRSQEGEKEGWGDCRQGLRPTGAEGAGWGGLESGQTQTTQPAYGPP